MNLVSDIDAYKSEPAENPDIILGQDWEERASEDGPDDDAQEDRNWLSLNRSPMARKIITFNLLALVVLVAGVMYFNPFRDSLVRTTEQSLINETSLIAHVFEAEMPSIGPVDLASGDGIDVTETLKQIELRQGLQAMVFDGNEALIATEVGRPWTETRPSSSGTLITDFLNNLWESAAGWMTSDPDPVAPLTPEAQARGMLALALAGEDGSATWRNQAGELHFTVVSPIKRGDVVLGAVAVTTLGGEIDQLVRLEREQLLQMFVVAVLVSVGLSLVLASTIANPLSDLAQAAESGRKTNAGKLAANRVRIPDMTGRPDEIGRLSGAMRGMVAALYDRIDSNEQFAADVAHEIKNPLASLRSAVGTMRIAKNDVQRGKLLDVIEHDVRRLDRLVSDISNASRLDSELVKEQMEPFNLIMTLNNLCVYHRQESDAKGIDFISDLPPDPVIIHGLEARLAQVFVNLITNALSFCEEGDAVRLSALRRDNNVLVIVEDTGPGIPDEALSRVFSRFYSERPSDDFGNHSGLGLAISKQIVEAHGGVIWAENIRPTSDDAMSAPLGARIVVGLPV